MKVVTAGCGDVNDVDVTTPSALPMMTMITCAA